VKADLDFDQRSTTTSRSPSGRRPDQPLVTESTSQETFAGPGASSAAGGVLGTNGQATNGAASTANNYSKNSADRSFAVGKVTEQVKAAPGKVTHLSVAVLLDDKVKAARPRSPTWSTPPPYRHQAGRRRHRRRHGLRHSAIDAAAKEQKAAAAVKSKTR